jgi:hypothetical protein
MVHAPWGQSDYARFCDAVVKLCPGADDERKFAESDLQ